MLALEMMCPERFRNHLKIVGREKLKTYEAMRVEIAERLFDELGRPTKQKAAACEALGAYRGGGTWRRGSQLHP